MKSSKIAPSNVYYWTLTLSTATHTHFKRNHNNKWSSFFSRLENICYCHIIHFMQWFYIQEMLALIWLWDFSVLPTDACESLPNCLQCVPVPGVSTIGVMWNKSTFDLQFEATPYKQTVSQWSDGCDKYWVRTKNVSTMCVFGWSI